MTRCQDYWCGSGILRQRAQQSRGKYKNQYKHRCKWQLRSQALGRSMVQRILRKYGYQPDKQEKATQTVLKQAEVLSGVWAVN